MIKLMKKALHGVNHKISSISAEKVRKLERIKLEKKAKESIQKVIEEYGETFRRLAEYDRT